MDKRKEKTYGIMILVIVCCVIMAFIETIIEPVYFVKSAIKVAVFLFFPLIYAKARNMKLFDHSFALDQKSILIIAAWLLDICCDHGSICSDKEFL